MSEWTSPMRASGRSILLMTTIGLRPAANAFLSTNRVCGSGPSAASTSTNAPSAIFRMRSTSPPKSAWPGRVDQVDLHIADADAAVLGQDGDAAFAFLVVGVHDQAVLPADELVELLGTEQARLPEHLVDERGFAVVNVGNDRDVPNIIPLHGWVRVDLDLEESSVECNLEVQRAVRKGSNGEESVNHPRSPGSGRNPRCCST